MSTAADLRTARVLLERLAREHAGLLRRHSPRTLQMATSESAAA